MTDSAGGPERSDQELVDAARQGDRAAFGVLWARHSEAARRVARSITHTFDADDLVSETYLKIMTAVAGGGGPTGPFRPYLFVTIRNLSVTWARRRREGTLDEADEVADPRATDSAVLAALDAGLTLQAFRTLPERWQEVLWFTEVEALSPAEIAVRLEMSANSVAALAYRAREGLRQAWIQAHIDTSVHGSEHQWVLNRVGKSARNGLSARNKDRFDDHLSGCPACTVIADEAVDASRRFTAVLLPLAVGITGSAGLSAFLRTRNAGGSSPSFTAQRTRARQSMRRRVLAVPAAVVAVALIGSVIGYCVDLGNDGQAGSGQARTEAGASTSTSTARPTKAPSSPSKSRTTPPAPQPAAIPPATTPSEGPAPDPLQTLPPQLATPSAPRSPGRSSVPTVVPVVMSADTKSGVLLPVIRGTARPSSVVTVRLGSASVSLTTDRSGRWQTGPMAVQPGTYTTSVEADGLPASSIDVTVRAPVVSLSSTSDRLTVTVKGAPRTRYILLAGSDETERFTGADGTVRALFASPEGPLVVRVYAADEQRVGPTTAISTN